MQASRREKHLDGVWAAVLTPFDASGALDLDGAHSNARRYRERFGLTGIFCNGIMGEGGALTVDERKAVLEAIVDGAGAGFPIGVVVTHHACRETIDLARRAGEARAHHVVLMRPRGPWSADELAAIGAAASDAAGLPLVLFESTAPGMSFGPAAIEKLARQTDVIGIKATGGVKAVASLRREFPELLTCDPHEDQHLQSTVEDPRRPLYADPEPYLYGVGGESPVVRYIEHARAGDLNAAVAGWRRLSPLRTVYDKWIIGPLDAGLSPVPALKFWAEYRGLKAGFPRFPLAPLSEAGRCELLNELRAADERIQLDR